MSKLINKTPKRLFTFGCSFTDYFWPTWAHIVAYDLNIPLYNYGRSAAGNQYIFNTIMQADIHYNFNEDDLVMICWSNIIREDRYKDDKWLLSGFIYQYNNEYDKEYVKKWVDYYWFAARDFSAIKATWEFLERRKCQFHFMKMNEMSAVDIVDNNDVYDKKIIELEKYYDFYLSKIEKSFFEVLWNNSIANKVKLINELVPNLDDGHPFIDEHLYYLENVFDHNFSKKTKTKVVASNKKLIKMLNEAISKKIHPSTLDYSKIFFKKSEDVFRILNR